MSALLFPYQGVRSWRKKNKPQSVYFAAGVDMAMGISAAYLSRSYSQKEITDQCGIHYSTLVALFAMRKPKKS